MDQRDTTGAAEAVVSEQEARADAYLLSLQALLLPPRRAVALNLLVALCAFLMGHPAIAAIVVISACAIDLVHQRLLKRWIAEAPETDEAVGFRKLAVLCAVRMSVMVTPVLAMALTGGLSELLYFGVQVCSIIALATAAGALSRMIFWAFVGPVIFATSLMILVLTPGQAAPGLLAVGTLLAMLTAILNSTSKTVGSWHAAFIANRAIVRQLEMARDQAIAERTAANAAREEARRANRAKSNFLATMSHEIRTPMNGVLGMAQLLRRDESDPLQQQRLEVLIDSGEYLLSILNDILDASKIDAGRLEIVPAVEDLRLFLDHLVGFWGARADQKGVVLGLDVDASAPDLVHMDALRMRQVLFNLVSNALKFTERGSVDVVADARPDGAGSILLHLAVRDTGPGIPAEHLPFLFERFSQADEQGARRFGGTGLGLSISKQLMELMGGRVWAESETGVGSTFHVEVPLRLAQTPALRPVVRFDETDAPTARTLRILAVDDNAVNLMVLDQLLGSMGHEVVRASDGPEALEALAAEAFDLVLMDIQMPGMSGVEALQRLQSAEGPNRHAPVVALTADVTSGGRERYLGLGFTEHSAKPIQIPDLLAAIDRATPAAPDDAADGRRSA